MEYTFQKNSRSERIHFVFLLFRGKDLGQFLQVRGRGGPNVPIGVRIELLVEWRLQFFQIIMMDHEPRL